MVDCTRDFGVGILGIGTYLPPDVRTNAWWSPDVIARWPHAQRHDVLERVARAEHLSDGEKRVIAAVAEASGDPFLGGRERRVLDPGASSIDMEVAAARNALNRAALKTEDIDVLLLHSGVPDYLGTNLACDLHHALGLKTDVLSLAVEGACNSFLLQLAVAEQMIAGGRARNALLVQSVAGSRVLDYTDQSSVMFGDGAAAAVVGRAPAGTGVLGRACGTDGSFGANLVIGPREGRWYDDGRSLAHWRDSQLGAEMILSIPEWARQSAEAALAQAGLSRKDVNFFACHQGMSWLRPVLQEHLDLGHARFVDSFAWASSLAGANIPLVLSVAEKEGLLKDGDLVLAFGGGGSATWSSAVIRWRGQA